MRRRTFLEKSSRGAAGLLLTDPIFSYRQPDFSMNPAIFKWLLELGKTIGTTILESSIATYIENKWFKDDVKEQSQQLGHQYQIGTLQYYDHRNYVFQYGSGNQNFFYAIIPDARDQSYPKDALVPYYNYNSTYNGLSLVLNYPTTVALCTAARDLKENNNFSERQLSKILMPIGAQDTLRVMEGNGHGTCLFNTYGGTVAIDYGIHGKDQFSGKLEFSEHPGMGFPKDYSLDLWQDK
jgi:hypothetical protein